MSLDQQIQAIVSRTASDIAHAVRQNIAAEVQRLVGGNGAGATTRARAGRPAAKPATKAKAVKKGRPAAKGRRGVDEKSLETILQFVTKNSGKRSEEIQKAAGIAPALAKKALVKLRETGKIKMKGVKRAATYAAA